MKFYKLRQLMLGRDKFAPTVIAVMSAEATTMLLGVAKAPIVSTMVFDYFQRDWLIEPNEDWNAKPIHALNQFDIYTISSIVDWALLEEYPAYLISPRLKKLLESFQLSTPHQFFPAKLMFNGQKLDYFVFRTYSSAFDSIVFPESKFWNYDMHNEQRVHPVAIRDQAHFWALRHQSARFFKFVSESLTYPQYSDFFFEVEGCFVVSQRLKQAMEANHITGVEFVALEVEFHFLDRLNL